MNTTQWCSAVWEQFCSAPWQAQAAVVMVLVLLGVGVAAVSLEAGRAAGWVWERAGRRREIAARAAVDPFVRVLRLPEDSVEREFRAIVEASGDDAEAAR